MLVDTSIECEIRLRRLRVWHWETALALRAKSIRCLNKRKARFLDKQASHHIKAVQILNDLFLDPGDTAEADAVKDAYKVIP